MIGIRSFILISVFSFGLVANADKYQLDPSHAVVVFKASHQGYCSVYGMFKTVTGSFEFNEKNPDTSNFDIAIKADSLTTLVDKRDEMLRKPDFLDAKQFPTINLKSQSLKKTGPNTYDVKAQLTLHGITKTISFQLTQGRVGADPMGKQKTGGDAKFTIKRSDYGMNFMQGPTKVGDEIEIMVGIEGVKS